MGGRGKGSPVSALRVLTEDDFLKVSVADRWTESNAPRWSHWGHCSVGERANETIGPWGCFAWEDQEWREGVAGRGIEQVGRWERDGKAQSKREATPRMVALAWGLGPRVWGCLSVCLSGLGRRSLVLCQSSLRTRQPDGKEGRPKGRQQCLELARMQASYGGRDETFAQFLVRPCCLLISSYKYF